MTTAVTVHFDRLYAATRDTAVAEERVRLLEAELRGAKAMLFDAQTRAAEALASISRLAADSAGINRRVDDDERVW